MEERYKHTFLDESNKKAIKNALESGLIVHVSRTKYVKTLYPRNITNRV